MMTLRSRSLACRTSRLDGGAAADQDVGADRVEVACAAGSTVSSASGLSAAGASVAWTRTWPSTTFGGAPGRPGLRR